MIINILIFFNSAEINFSRPVIDRVLDALESHPLPNLSSNEQAHLIVLIQTTLEVGFNTFFVANL